MIVEPTPTTSRAPIRRALGAAVLAVPVLLLLVAIGAGTLGNQAPAALPATTPAASAGGPAVAASPAAGAGTSTPARGLALPSQFGDLRVVPVAQAAEVAIGAGPATAVALSGYLWITGTDPACEPADGEPLGPWCDRRAELVDWTFANGSTFADDAPPHVNLVIPAGVRVPSAVATAMTRPGGDGPHVIVVGRFTPTKACAEPGGCDPGFVVDRFAWADGLRMGLTPLLAGPLATSTKRANPFAVMDAASMPLMAVLVWPDGLGAIDPDAAAVAASRPSSQPVWFVRVLDGARGPGMERRVLWLLLDERELQVIDSGRPGWYRAPRWVTG